MRSVSSDKLIDAASVRVGLAQTLTAHVMMRLQRRHSTAGIPSLAVFSLDRVSSQISAHGIYEKLSLDLLLNDASLNPEGVGSLDVVVDAGAHVGNHALYFSRYANTVLAFEPNPALHALLHQNVNGSANIRTFEQALSSHSGTATLEGAVDNLGGASIVGQDKASSFKVDVYAVALDDVQELFLGRRVSLIKCDVEGAEADVIAGARQTIRRHKPLLVIEFAKNVMLRRQILSAIEALECNYRRVWWPENFRAVDSWLRGVLFGKRASLISSCDFDDIPLHRLPYVAFQADSENNSISS